MDPTLQALDRQAAQALARGALDDALRSSRELERRDPAEPNWARRSAYVLRRMGRRAEELASMERAAQLWAGRRDFVRALAAYRRILEIDPRHAAARARVRSLAGVRGAPAPTPRPAAERVRLPPPGQQTSLDQVAWRQAVGRSQQIRGDAAAGVHHIALGEPVSPTLDLAASEPEAPPRAPDDVEAAVASVEREFEQLQRTEQALQDTTLFRALNAEGLEALVDRVRFVSVRADAYVVRQGQAGHELFVIVEGEAGVIDEGPPQRPLARLGAGDFFGEGALVTDQPRSASVAALADLELIVVDRDTLWSVLEAQPDLWPSLLSLFRDRAVDRIMMQSPLFTALSSPDRAIIRPYFRLIEVDPGADALVENAMADALSFVIAGELEVLREGEPLGRLRAGNLFGETSLLCREPSAIGVRAVDRSYLVEFPGPAFLRIVETRPRAMTFISNIVAQRRRALEALRERQSESGVFRVM